MDEGESSNNNKKNCVRERSCLCVNVSEIERECRVYLAIFFFHFGWPC